MKRTKLFLLFLSFSLSTLCQKVSVDWSKSFNADHKSNPVIIGETGDGIILYSEHNGKPRIMLFNKRLELIKFKDVEFSVNQKGAIIKETVIANQRIILLYSYREGMHENICLKSLDVNALSFISEWEYKIRPSTIMDSCSYMLEWKNQQVNLYYHGYSQEFSKTMAGIFHFSNDLALISKTEVKETTGNFCPVKMYQKGNTLFLLMHSIRYKYIPKIHNLDIGYAIFSFSADDSIFKKDSLEFRFRSFLYSDVVNGFNVTPHHSPFYFFNGNNLDVFFFSPVINDSFSLELCRERIDILSGRTVHAKFARLHFDEQEVRKKRVQPGIMEIFNVFESDSGTIVHAEPAHENIDNGILVQVNKYNGYFLKMNKQFQLMHTIVAPKAQTLNVRFHTAGIYSMLGDRSVLFYNDDSRNRDLESGARPVNYYAGSKTDICISVVTGDTIVKSVIDKMSNNTYEYLLPPTVRKTNAGDYLAIARSGNNIRLMSAHVSDQVN